ncbi:MAG: LytR C-terminal domain-containing protein [Thermoleophilia bacterium]|nr:LytR C-terminal domain-containing protein [Thermoleophilia bacterium]
MSEQDPERRAPNATRRRAALGYDARSERRAVRGAVRRRKARTRLWLMAGPAVVVIAAVVIVLVLLGGPDAESEILPTSTTVAPVPRGDVDLLVIEEEASARFLALIRSRDEGGLVVAMPGITLLKTAQGFKTLTEMHAADDSEALKAALAAELGVSLETTVAVSGSELAEAMATAGVQMKLAVLDVSLEEAESVALSVLALLEAAVSENGDALWGGLALEGDADQFRTDMRAAAPSLKDWETAALTGRVVQGDGFEYLEPELETLRVLLAGPTEGAAITVKIQNGAGMVGVVEQANAELGALGYKLESAGNSSDFPNAGKTRITVGIDAAEAGRRVQELLGVGAITEDMLLDPGTVVVVLGTDYVPLVSATVPTT